MNGYFEFLYIYFGIYWVIVFYLGYDFIEKEVKVIGDILVIFYLKFLVMVLNEVVVIVFELKCVISVFIVDCIVMKYF